MSETHPRPKMTLGEQAALLRRLLGRCRMADPSTKGVMASETLLALRPDDLAAIEAIEQTLLIFELHGADKYVRGQIGRRFQAAKA